MKRLADMAEIAADQREQIAGLGEGIAPERVMPAAVELAGLDRIAIAEQHGRLGDIGLDARRIDAQHIRPIEKIGDAAEALRLALRAIGGAGAIEPGQLRIGGRVDLGLDLEDERRLEASPAGSADRASPRPATGRAVESAGGAGPARRRRESGAPRRARSDCGESTAAPSTRVLLRCSEISRSTESIRKSGGR